MKTILNFSSETRDLQLNWNGKLIGKGNYQVIYLFKRSDNTETIIKFFDTYFEASQYYLYYVTKSII